MRTFAPITLVVGLTFAKSPANFNISKADAEAHGCGYTCQKYLAITHEADIQTVGRDFDFDFFATASLEDARPLMGLLCTAMTPGSCWRNAGTPLWRPIMPAWAATIARISILTCRRILACPLLGVSSA